MCLISRKYGLTLDLCCCFFPVNYEFEAATGLPIGLVKGSSVAAMKKAYQLFATFLLFVRLFYGMSN